MYYKLEETQRHTTAPDKCNATESNTYVFYCFYKDKTGIKCEVKKSKNSFPVTLTYLIRTT